MFQPFSKPELCICLLMHTLFILFLLFRFLSIPKGFSYLNERGYVSKQLDKWQKVLLILVYCNIVPQTNKCSTL